MSILGKLTTWFQQQKQDILDVLTPFEHQFLHDFHPFARQVEHAGGQLLVDAVKAALAAATAGVETGGNAGAIVSSAAATAIASLEAEGKPAVKNAVYGLVAIGMAALPGAEDKPV